jgi:hypothetical protein
MAHIPLPYDAPQRPTSIPTTSPPSLDVLQPKQDIARPASSVTFAERAASLVSTTESSKMPDTPKTTYSASSSSTDLEKAVTQPVEDWKPEKKEWFIMISLSIISFMVALDATILVTVLPVRVHTTQI